MCANRNVNVLWFFKKNNDKLKSLKFQPKETVQLQEQNG